jgi:multidrug efflux pump subunit AcrB
MGILLIAGFLMTFLIKREVFPTFNIDRVQVLVPYPGASPSEVEQGLVQPVEEALTDIDGID